MWQPKNLPFEEDLETRKVLKKLAIAHRALAELKGIAETIPNQTILLNTLSLQEAKDSSEVENIITTHDALYKAELDIESISEVAAKEVQNYVAALKHGHDLVKKHNLLTNRHIISIQSLLENNHAGFRRVPGTSLKNQSTGQIIYQPPQHPDEINALMGNLENYINNDELSEVDILIKMAVIHFQFESIHPFYDGNGRTGRIINILYLIQKGLLTIPILYLSRYINQHKGKYYKYIQGVRDNGDWEQWLLYMIDGVEQTAKQNIVLIKEIKTLMLDYKHQIREQYKFYSQDLLNTLFKHPYVKIEFIMEDLKVSRPTASNYLNSLAKGGLLEKHKIGKHNYYINSPLFNLFTEEYIIESQSLYS